MSDLSASDPMFSDLTKLVGSGHLFFHRRIASELRLFHKAMIIDTSSRMAGASIYIVKDLGSAMLLSPQPSSTCHQL
jgi:hypothetical protein